MVLIICQSVSFKLEINAWSNLSLKDKYLRGLYRQFIFYFQLICMVCTDRARYKYGHFINFNFQFMMNEELLYRKCSWQYFRIIPYIKTYLIKLFDCADKKCRIKDQSSYRPIDSPVKLKCENKYKKCSWSQYRSNTIKIAPLKCVHFSQKLKFVAAIVTQDLVDFLSSFLVV